MSLDRIDWGTLTKDQARRLHVDAERREARIMTEYEDGEATTAQLRAAQLLESDLWFFSVDGRRPDLNTNLERSAA